MVKAPRPIPPAVRDAQARASDPKASTFVSANAGSGKTHVLVQRVIRLLLSGVPPEKILCITFTKAAAANMAERVFTTLGHWVTLDDAGLDAAIREAGIAHPSALAAARGAKTVCLRAGDARRPEGADHPRAVHPAAAAVPVRGQRAGALRRARRPRPERDDGARQSRRVPGGVANSRQRRSAARCATAMANAADVTFKEVVREACLSRDHFMAWTDAAGNATAAAAQMSAALGVSTDDRIEDVEREIVDGPNLPRSSWKEMATLLDTSSKADQKQAERLRAALSFTGAAQVDEYLGVFLTDDRAPRASVITNNFIKKNPVARQQVRGRDRPARSADRAAPRRGGARPHRGADPYRDRGGGALPAREAGARPARLRRPDRQDARRCSTASRRAGCITSSTAASTTC